MNDAEEYINNLSHLDYMREYNKTESNVKKLTNEIAGKERTINSLKKRESVQQYINLLEDQFVQNYIKADKELESLEGKKFSEKQKFQLLKQLLCKHQLVLVTQEIKTYEILDEEKISQGIIPKEDYITYGKCLLCDQRLTPVDRNKIDQDGLVYIKPRSENYYLSHEDVIEAQSMFNSMKSDKKCSYKDLGKKLSRRFQKLLIRRKGEQHEQDENTRGIKG